jgi:SEL1 protein
MGEIRLLEDYTKNIAKSFNKFQRAAAHGHLAGTMHLATMYLKGHGSGQNCLLAVTVFLLYFFKKKYLKALVEKADWHNPYIENAHSAYEAGDSDSALINYMFAAESGYEVAQINSAFMLENGRYSSNLSDLFNSNLTNKYQIALPHLNRAANQGNVDARVKLGDYYYNGHLKNESSMVDYSRAAAYYRVAGESEFSALGMYALLKI